LRAEAGRAQGQCRHPGAAPVCLDEAFGKQELVGKQHAVARHAPIGGQLAGAGQARSGRQAPVEDGRLEQLVQAQLARLTGSGRVIKGSENEGEGHLAP